MRIVFQDISKNFDVGKDPQQNEKMVKLLIKMAAKDCMAL